MTPQIHWSLRPGKSWLLIPIPLALMLAVAGIIVYPWARRLDLLDPHFAMLARINAFIWLLVLWWSLHHLVFQVAVLLTLPARRTSDPLNPKVNFVVLYLTCDDFQPVACESCLSQDYRSTGFRVLICDDSRDPQRRAEIDTFAGRHPDVRVVRRVDRTGFKAGNLNHAFSETHENENWLLIADADQILPRGYLLQLAGIVAELPEDVAFVQTANEPARGPELEVTTFQEALETEIRLFYERDLVQRQKFGFLPALGHGIAVRRSAWQRLEGFPELVSEDYAFSLAVSSARLRGVYVEEVCSQEALPRNFEAFTIRLRKFAGGSAELLRKASWKFFRSKASLVEKVDFAMLLLWYPLLPFLLCNGFLSAYVCYRWWSLGISALHPALPYIFLGMFLLCLCVIASTTRGVRKAARYWFWATSVYNSLIPLGSWHFLLHLFRNPTFERTPKQDGETPRLGLASVVTLSVGLVAISLALLWWSPFSPVLASYGTSYAAFPLFRFLNRQNLLGRIARIVIWVPGSLLLIALYTMWFWGSL
jgi:cellulose synthase/poly-beta-1,6-N-acetylglucosamine synthase-like glycosyltransferase